MMMTTHNFGLYTHISSYLRQFGGHYNLSVNHTNIAINHESIYSFEKKEKKSDYNLCSMIIIGKITSLPMIAIEGTVNSHGTCPNTAISKGLVHNNTNVAATISYIQ